MIAYDTIKTLRKERHYSQEDMATKLGMSVNGYAKIERGESRPDFERLQQIATVLGVSLLELLDCVDKNIVVQTQNHNANYHYNHYASAEQLQAQNERLLLVIAHQSELLTQKDEQIKLLKRLAQIDDFPELPEL